MIPNKDDSFWINNGTQPIQFEKMPLQIYAAHQGEVTIFLSLEEIDTLIQLVYGDEIVLHARSIRQKILGRESSIFIA